MVTGGNVHKTIHSSFCVIMRQCSGCSEPVPPLEGGANQQEATSCIANAKSAFYGTQNLPRSVKTCTSGTRFDSIASILWDQIRAIKILYL